MTAAYQGTHIVQITDTTDRNARLRIKSAYARHAARHGIGDAAVDVEPATGSLDIGVLVSELAGNTERPERLILAVNCAPPDKASGTQDNARNDFYCADLGDGVTVCGTSNGLELAYVRDRIKSLYRLTLTNSKKSQFRSLQILPEYSVAFSDIGVRAQLIRDGALEKIEDIGSVVPKIPDISHVIEVDNFGNVKLYLSEQDHVLLKNSVNSPVSVDFTKTSTEVTGKPESTGEVIALVTPTLFDAFLDTTLLSLKSSSTLAGQDVPVIATLRERPGETPPNFTPPRVGTRVLISALS